MKPLACIRGALLLIIVCLAGSANADMISESATGSIIGNASLPGSSAFWYHTLPDSSVPAGPTSFSFPTDIYQPRNEGFLAPLAIPAGMTISRVTLSVSYQLDYQHPLTRLGIDRGDIIPMPVDRNNPFYRFPTAAGTFDMNVTSFCLTFPASFALCPNQPGIFDLTGTDLTLFERYGADFFFNVDARQYVHIVDPGFNVSVGINPTDAYGSVPYVLNLDVAYVPEIPTILLFCTGLATTVAVAKHRLMM